ncbi:hypothetical protein [Alistipes putredinis]|uniref:hypothetical protein n=2 Tax=Alistipes putredinis TaxID=28117 RepID=UPI003996AE8A
MLFRPGNPDDRIHHHALDRDRQPNLGRDKSQIGVFGTDYTTPKTGCPTAGVIDTIFFRKVVPTGGNRQNFRHDFQLLPQPFFWLKSRETQHAKNQEQKKPILLIFKAFILPIPIQQDAKWK